MNIFESISQIKDWRAQQDQRIGFVPTMGALHQGHFSLIREAKKSCDLVVVSIFVNPTQFNKSEDFENYPSNLKLDLDELKKLNVDAVFLPKTQEMYHDDFRFKIIEECESLELCGKNRPGHFSGVLSIVSKLLNIVQPQKAFFGEKDFQQFKLIKDFCQAMFVPVTIVGLDTQRDEHGLALSSRNQRLSDEGLNKARQMAKIFADDLLTLEQMNNQIKEIGFEVDYLEEKWGRRFIAATIENVRLIDNRKSGALK